MSEWKTPPPDEEFAVWLRGDLGQMGHDFLMEPQSEADARRRLAGWREDRPDVISVLLVRQVVRRPWSVAVRSNEPVS